MFLKFTQSKGRRYVQLVEAFRDDAGHPRQRTVATLGRLDEDGGAVDAMLNRLAQAKGRRLDAGDAAPQVQFESALALGDVWALDQLWRELGFTELAAVFRRARFTAPVEPAIRAMVFNRLCDADSKLGVLRWLKTVSMPGLKAENLTHKQLLRAMDALMDHREAVDACVAGLLRPLIDQELSLVFYDLTTIRAEGLSEQVGDVRKFGMAKEGIVARQFMLGVVQTADGMPIHHEVFEGNQAEAPTLLPTLKKVLERYSYIRRLVVVADRGLLSLDNIEELRRSTLPDGQPLEFILAVPGRRYGEFTDVLQAFQAKAAAASSEVIDEARWQDLRLVVAHNPAQATEQTARRRDRIKELEARAAQLASKLDGQEAGVRSRGRQLSDGGATARFYHEVSESHLLRIVRVDLKSPQFVYSLDDEALARAELMDGKLLLVTNVADLKPAEVVASYKALADIERGFRVLKSEIEIAPVFHRLPDRIRAHAMLCFIALILYRVMRGRLKLAGVEVSPERALEQLRTIQRHRVRINDAEPIDGISSIDAGQAHLFQALKLPKPTRDAQMTLL
ncbi:MAG: IS1634 family transposase [Thiomonas sp. 13-66-29]|jgi:transposase|nr:MAG: IS1634 family transposase [Thiomonas sp. 13-66-29]